MKGISLVYIEYEDLTEDLKKELWDQNINLDDVDFVVLAPKELIEETTFEDQQYNEEGRLVPVLVKYWKCKRWTLDNLLERHGAPIAWYKGQVEGHEFAICVGYHS